MGPPQAADPTASTRLGLVAFALAASIAHAAAAAPPTLPFADVRQGMRGEGRTVFEGTRIERFEVEILGTLPRIGPGQDLILARLSGGPLADTGVLAGMSGSPVYVDGRLVGAVAYTWGFATAPIAGITPIGEMLELARTGGGSRASAGEAIGEGLARLRGPAAIPAFFEGRLATLARRVGPFPVTLPLAVSGLGTEGLARLSPQLSRAGFLPLQAGSAAGRDGETPRLEPGAAIGLKLIRGDLDVTATGTATWVENDQVLGLGHPLFGLGSVDLPLTGARVEAILPSLQQSARIATPLGEVGAVRQDRAAGVWGRIGAEPRMIPVRLELAGTDGRESRFAFDIADDPLLSPLLLYASLNGILANRERAVGPATIRLREGSGIRLVGAETVALDNLFAGPEAFAYGTGIAAYALHLLMNNTWAPPRIAGINLLFEIDEAPRTATIRRAACDRYRAAPGDEVQVSVVLSPFRGPDRVLVQRLRLPPETPPGVLTIDVGGALEISRDEMDDELTLPRDLDQLIGLINQLRRNDQAYVAVSREDTGLLLGGARLPNLPPSASTLLGRPPTRGNVVALPRRRVAEQALPTDHVVEGSARLELRVEAR